MKKLLIPLMLLPFLTGCGMRESEFSVVKNPESYTIEAVILNTTLSDTYELSAGDTIKVGMSVDSGEFEITIKSDGDPVYEGNGAGLDDFTVNIPSDGVYTISVAGKDGQGSLSFEIIKGGENE